MMNPDPLPPDSRPFRRPPVLDTSIFTTDGLTASAALTTASEYASSNGPSDTGNAGAAGWPFNIPCSSVTGNTPEFLSAILMLHPRLSGGMVTSKPDSESVKRRANQWQSAQSGVGAKRIVSRPVWR
jgi:hypothetical protein